LFTPEISSKLSFIPTSFDIDLVCEVSLCVGGVTFDVRLGVGGVTRDVFLEVGGVINDVFLDSGGVSYDAQELFLELEGDGRDNSSNESSKLLLLSLRGGVAGPGLSLRGGVVVKPDLATSKLFLISGRGDVVFAATFVLKKS